MSVLEWFQAGGFVMFPLLFFSLLAWGVIFERFWRYRKLYEKLPKFQHRALEYLLKNDWDLFRSHCDRYSDVPTASILKATIEKLHSKQKRDQSHWLGAAERKRREENLRLKKNLWVLGTIATASPFIGLFGTVVGILKAFREMALTGSGGFAVVAAGISEALVATAAGIIVAVVASIGFNAFQNRWSELVFRIKLQSEELLEAIDPSQVNPELKD